jgi:hypothetical protein
LKYALLLQKKQYAVRIPLELKCQVGHLLGLMGIGTGLMVRRRLMKFLETEITMIMGLEFIIQG